MATDVQRITWQDCSTLLRHIRKCAGISQAELAVRMGCHKSHICRLESGQRHPSRAFLRLLAYVCDPAESDRRLLTAFEQMAEYHCDALDLDLDVTPRLNPIASKLSRW
jgi:transcriptional regulator with XRE-family HTH domain